MATPMTPTHEGMQLAADLANAGRVTRPQGEPGLIAGTCIVLAGWLLIATVAAIMPEPTHTETLNDYRKQD